MDIEPLKIKEKYSLHFCEWLDIIQHQKYSIGCFYDNEEEKEIVKIILDDNELKKIRMRNMVTASRNGNYSIIVSSEFATDFINNPLKYKQFLFYHELGHILNKHFEKYNDYEEIRKQRNDAIGRHEVSSDELEADFFAAQALGFKTAIIALKKMYKSRYEFNKKHNIQHLPRNKSSLEELEMRINKLKEHVK